jgi:hypothetical protein
MLGAPHFLIERPRLRHHHGVQRLVGRVPSGACADAGDEALARRRRQVAGGTPNVRLKARLNAASDS